MADHFANGFWDGDYWVESYFGTDVAGSMVAGLSGSGSVSATISIAETETRRGDDAGFVEHRRRFKRRRLTPADIIAIVEAIQAAEEAEPKPTVKKRKALTRKIVETVGEDTLFAPAMKPVETFVRQEVKQFYQPGVSWAEVYTAVTRLIEAAQAEAQRIENEIEEEDEMILLMVA